MRTEQKRSRSHQARSITFIRLHWVRTRCTCARSALVQTPSPRPGADTAQMEKALLQPGAIQRTRSSLEVRTLGSKRCLEVWARRAPPLHGRPSRLRRRDSWRATNICSTCRSWPRLRPCCLPLSFVPSRILGGGGEGGEDPFANMTAFLCFCFGKARTQKSALHPNALSPTYNCRRRRGQTKAV